jgi:hypothetical protein
MLSDALRLLAKNSRTRPVRPSSPEAGHDDSAKKSPAFREGVVVNPKKPKAADYEDIVQALIIRAAFEYEALVSTKNSFPDTALRHKWAVKVWKNLTQDTEEHYVMTDAISSLVCPRNAIGLYLTV